MVVMVRPPSPLNQLQLRDASETSTQALGGIPMATQTKTTQSSTSSALNASIMQVRHKLRLSRTDDGRHLGNLDEDNKKKIAIIKALITEVNTYTGLLGPKIQGIISFKYS